MSRIEDTPEAAETIAPAVEEERELEERVSGYLKLGIPAATLVGATVGGLLQGPGAVVLALAAGALVSVIAIFWASIRTLAGETGLSGADAYAIGAPRAEEEQKRAVLRALKDLEFERSVGKISNEDYDALVTKYRTEAKRLLRVLDSDAAPRREMVESLVRKRLKREGLLDEAPSADEPTGKPEKVAEKPRKKDKSPEKAAKTCGKCGKGNDVDAAFCKKCGARLPGSDEESDAVKDADEGGAS